jgi:hypothetical protein
VVAEQVSSECNVGVRKRDESGCNGDDELLIGNFELWSAGVRRERCDGVYYFGVGLTNEDVCSAAVRDEGDSGCRADKRRRYDNRSSVM